MKSDQCGNSTWTEVSGSFTVGVSELKMNEYLAGNIVGNPKIVSQYKKVYVRDCMMQIMSRTLDGQLLFDVSSVT